MMRSSYKDEDVILLLKDITGLVEPLENEEREKMIQSGVHYCEMLPKEHLPSGEYMQTFYDALRNFSDVTADATASVAEKIIRSKGENTVLVSLARAGTPVGILIKKYIRFRFGIDVPHYSISIIRGRGIDNNAMKYILKRHAASDIQFVDGWTGKGAIQRELTAAMKDYPGVDPQLAVLSDCPCIAGVSGTYDDILIASSCLNSTVSGLISRTFLRSDIIGKDDFHGAKFYEEFRDHDVTYKFIDTIASRFPDAKIDRCEKPVGRSGISEVRNIADKCGISDINLVKPGIGEATRVLLRRVPWKILVNSLDDSKNLGHIYELANEKHIPIEKYSLVNYRACGLIKSLADS